jgi:protein TonB
MFDTVLARGAAGQTHRGAGAIASFFLHGAALLAAVALSAGAKQATTSKVDKPMTIFQVVPPKPLKVTFQDAPAPGPAKPSNAAAVRTHTPQPPSKPPPSNPERTVINPAAAPTSLDSSPGGSDAPSDNAGGGAPGPGGPGIGDGAGAGTGTGSVVMDMMPGVNRPVRIAGSDPTYTREALQARVLGKVLVKCVVMTDGSVRNCRIIKGLPYMDQAVLQALAAQRYTPATFQGRPVSVNYLFTFNFTLP